MTSTLALGDIEAIERATLDAVAPERIEALPGWLLPMDHGTVGRARSAVPLRHVPTDPVVLDLVIDRYRARGFAPAFRLPDLPAFGRLHEALQARGFMRDQPTLTLCGSVHHLQAVHPGPACELMAAPDRAWLAMFLGDGFDPVDGASRAQALSRAHGMRYASVREGGQTVACGAAAFGHGWLGVHGMRTAAAHRGRGLAGRVLHTLAGEALRRGLQRVFLQVSADNIPALSLYRRAGLVTAWPYAYWRRPVAAADGSA